MKETYLKQKINTHTHKVKDKRELCTYDIIHGEKKLYVIHG